MPAGGYGYPTCSISCPPTTRGAHRLAIAPRADQAIGIVAVAGPVTPVAAVFVISRTVRFPVVPSSVAVPVYPLLSPENWND